MQTIENGIMCHRYAGPFQHAEIQEFQKSIIQICARNIRFLKDSR